MKKIAFVSLIITGFMYLGLSLAELVNNSIGKVYIFVNFFVTFLMFFAAFAIYKSDKTRSSH